MTIEIISNSQDETQAAGERLSKNLVCGSVVALSGTLGSGKTCFARGIAFGLGITENITSPTYTIINEYQIPCGALYHIDAYRLENDRDFEEIGGQGLFCSNGITVIEWSERISKSLPQDTISVSLEIKGETSRRILIKGIDNFPQ